MGKVSSLIEKKLNEALSPSFLEVVDDSAAHAGHAGNPDGAGESHFNVVIRAKAFEGKSRVARQRLVMDSLREELKSQIHALSIKAELP